ncbi:MAG: saccharopine dehydrogenase family protein [Actinomycetota bacterium]
MRAIVLGACGAVGREVAGGLAAVDQFDEVILADLDRACVRALARAIGVRCSARGVEGSDVPSLRKAIRGGGVLVNCTTYLLGVPALRAAIAERVDYLDLGGLYNTPRQLALHDRACRAGVRAVIGCGATPGLSNVLARRAVERLDEVHEIHISFASHRDLALSPGLLDTLLDEFRPGVPRFAWRGGRLREVAPFEGARRVRFAPPLGAQEVYYVPHSETYTLPRSFGPGLREVSVRGTWRPADMRTLAELSRLGLTSDRAIRVNGVMVKPLDVLRAVLLADPPEEEGAPCAFFLDVEVVGRGGGSSATIRQRTSHPVTWGPDATARMTAIPAVVGATLLVEGESEPGVIPPERAFDPDRFIRGVRRAGVRVTTSAHPGHGVRTRSASARG